MKKLILLFLLSSACVIAQIAPEWEFTYPMSVYGQSEKNPVLKDNGGNIIFLSYSNIDSNNVSGGYVFIGKVSISGSLLWRRIYSRPGLDSGDYPVSMVLDNQNNIYILNSSHGYNSGIDFGVIKYDQNGNFLWDYFYTSPGGINSYDYSRAITVDNQNNCYVTGSSPAGFYIDSIVTIKLNSSGVMQWNRSYISTQTRLSTGECLLADNSLNLYVGGMVNDSGNGFMNAVLLKYNSAGALQWTKKYSGSQSMSDCFLDLKFDNSGNIVATGSADGDYYLDSASVLLQKYNTSGNLIWSQVFHTINPGGEVGTKLLLDNADNIFVLGASQPYPLTSSVTLLFKYNSAGSLQWSKRHGDYYSNQSYPFNISFDNSQNILISGYERKYNRTNLMLLKYNNSDGNKLWSYLYSNTGSSIDLSTSSFYQSNNLYITGKTNNSLLLMKMQPTGSFNYTFRRDNLNKPVLDSQYTYDTVMLNADQLPPNAYIRYINVSIDTLLHGAMGDIEITLKNGNMEDTLFYRRGGPFDNMIGTNLNDTSALNICGNGLPPFTGYFAPCRTLSKHLYMPGSGPWILKVFDRKAPDTGVLKSWSLTLGYETLIGINPISSEVPKTYSLMQNYPNPFNPVTKIKFNLPNAGNTKITVYDVSGREVSIPVNEFLVQGIYEIGFNGASYSSGVYFYRIESGNFTETKKMILVK